MALTRHSVSEANSSEFIVGAVIFDTTLPSPFFRCYHAMLIRPGAARSTPEGKTSVPISDMTTAGINWPEKEQWHELHEQCYVGDFPEADRDLLRSVVEELRGLRRDPQAAENDGVYSLATHGVYKKSPNDPNAFLPGIYCSCSSLIEHCYEQASKNLDLVREESVPLVDAKKLWTQISSRAYNSSRVLTMLNDLGLPGTGPWHVLLPAYQMRAFAKGLSSLPHDAGIEDHPYQE